LPCDRVLPIYSYLPIWRCPTQLRLGWMNACVVDLLEADALILHLNPPKSALTKGDTNFRGLPDKITNLCIKMPVPVIAKEVGNGISGAMAEKLIAAGVAAIDVAGAGGLPGRRWKANGRKMLSSADWDDVC